MIFIGALIHATIVAYSSSVPTIVVGYSVKAKGIAKDLFGTYENYVLSEKDLKQEDEITEAFKWLMDSEIEVRRCERKRVFLDRGKHQNALSMPNQRCSMDFITDTTSTGQRFCILVVLDEGTRDV